jgi:radical SAM superfamily enzyme YgiQ (UPF0313 family)
VTDSIVAALKQAGCRTAWIGAESGSQRILDAMEKGTRVEQIAAAARRLHAADIDVGFFLQFGYPGETLDDIELTLRMVRECRPDDIGVSVSYPLPGTRFYERVKAQLGEKQNWVDSNDLAMMYRATYEPAFYRALHSLVHAQFRARKLSAARSMRAATAAVYHAARAPFLQRKVRLLARATAGPAVLIHPVLTQQAAAIPTDQP